MNELVLSTRNMLPRLINDAGVDARTCFLNFFTSKIRNLNTRRSYAKACEEFLAWCSFVGVPSITAVLSIAPCYLTARSFGIPEGCPGWSFLHER
jgi:hypothetical protein